MNTLHRLRDMTEQQRREFMHNVLDQFVAHPYVLERILKEAIGAEGLRAALEE